MARLAKEKYLVLMVDDLEDDCLLIKLAMDKAQHLSFIGSLADGDEVIDYLEGKGEYSDRTRYPIPDLLLLDLKMPRKTGFEVLQWLRGQPFRDMVVVVLSGSDRPADVQQALQLGADHYHTKEADPQKRDELIKALEAYVARSGAGSKE